MSFGLWRVERHVLEGFSHLKSSYSIGGLHVNMLIVLKGPFFDFDNF